MNTRRMAEKHEVPGAKALRPIMDQRRVVDLACDFLSSRIQVNPSLDEIARATGVNRFLLLRYFKRVLGTTPHAYLIRIRIERAQDILQRSSSLAEVAALFGFADQAHFTRLFKRLVGMTPGEYSKQVPLRTSEPAS